MSEDANEVVVGDTASAELGGRDKGAVTECREKEGAKLQRSEAVLVCWCHGGAKCRGGCDGCADRFDAGKTLGASSARARSTRVEDDLVGDVEQVESLMLRLDDECVELGVGGTAR